MSRWFRLYDDVINDPKILRLSDSMFRAWMTLLCLASKHDGALPSTNDIALVLRLKATKVAEWLAMLTAAGLLDNEEGTFRPHNWDGRQFKSDVTDPTAATRQKAYRSRIKNRNATVTVTDTRAETEQITETDQISEANASGAVAPVDHRKRLFDEGLPKLAAMTGKGPDACRSFVGKCLKAAGDDAITVLGLIEDAERNQVVNPSAWIAARLKPVEMPNGTPHKPGVVEVARRLAEQFESQRGDGIEGNPNAVLRISQG